jgi:DnaJ-class molecular chaperone
MQLNDEPLSYYDILELTADATPQEIRSAYLRLKSSYSKDNVANYSVYSREETDQMLQKIEEAYLILSNPERRKAYDLSHQGHSSVTAHAEHSSFRAEPVPAPVMPSISNINQTHADPFFIHSDTDSFVSSEQEWSGLAIKRARESKRITIEDLADYTRISKSYLIALEEEAYQKLPAVVYVRGFLQQVSKRLKLPADLVVKKYIDRLKAARPDKF